MYPEVEHVQLLPFTRCRKMQKKYCEYHRAFCCCASVKLADIVPSCMR